MFTELTFLFCFTKELMDLGSLSDLLKNESMVLEGDIIAPILSDIFRSVTHCVNLACRLTR